MTSVRKSNLNTNIKVGGQVCASGSCVKSHNAEPSTYRNVNRFFFLPQQSQPSRIRPKVIARHSRPIYCAASFIIAKLPKAAEAISWRGMILPCTFQVLAMTAENSLMNQATTKIGRPEAKGGGYMSIVHKH